MNKFLCALLGLHCIFLSQVQAQAPAESLLTLAEYVSMARGESPAALRADTRRENRYWQYRTFQSQYRPQLVLNSTLPQYSNSIQGVPQPDGTIDFLPVNQNTSRLSLGLQQVVPWTGGTVSVVSSIQRFDNFSVDSNNINYQSNPFFFRFTQPLTFFNQFKWDRAISPLAFEESKRAYVEEIEQLSQLATELYFNLLLAQRSYEIAVQNVANNDEVYKIAQGRFQLGKIPENDLLQLELNLMNSQLAVSQAELDFETASLELKSFVGLPPSANLVLAVPQDMPEFTVDMELALEEASANRSEALSFERRQLEAQRDVASARANAGVNGDLVFEFGVAGQGNNLEAVANNLIPNTVANVGLRVPILNGGRLKAVRETAEANARLTEYTLAQDKINFEQEVSTQVRQFDMLRERVKITKTSEEVAQRRYDIANNRYKIGKISITDLSRALEEKDRAVSTYIESLRNLWTAYYNLRRLTLYDFESGTELYVHEEE
ncbi:MAG: TolC family protein [Bacteroidota bacterium]